MIHDFLAVGLQLVEFTLISLNLKLNSLLKDTRGSSKYEVAIEIKLWKTEKCRSDVDFIFPESQLTSLTDRYKLKHSRTAEESTLDTITCSQWCHLYMLYTERMASIFPKFGHTAKKIMHSFSTQTYMK